MPEPRYSSMYSSICDRFNPSYGSLIGFLTAGPSVDLTTLERSAEY